VLFFFRAYRSSPVQHKILDDSSDFPYNFQIVVLCRYSGSTKPTEFGSKPEPLNTVDLFEPKPHH
jgi:hypothetical protein